MSFGDEHELHAGREGDLRLVNGRQEYAMPDLPALVRKLTHRSGQILIEQRLYAEVEDDIEMESVGEVTLEGFQRPIAAFNVVAVRETAAELSQL